MVSVTFQRTVARARVHDGQWGMTASLVVLATAASTGMIGLIDGPSWWFAFTGISILLLLSAAGLRTLGVPRLAVPIIGAVELLAVLTASFGGGHSVVAFVPTPATFQRFGELFALARVSLDQQAVPADSLPEFLFLITLFAGIAALLLDLIACAARRPALTAIVMAVMLIVPSLLLPTGISPLSLVACIAAYLLVLRVDTRRRSNGWGELGMSLSVAAAVTVVALTLSTTAPGFQQIGRQGIAGSGILIGAGVNPLIDLGADLRRPAPVPVFTYTTTAKTTPYLRLTALDQFTGTIWRHRDGSTKSLPASGNFGPVPGLAAGVASTKIETDVQIQNMESAWIPAPYPATGVQGLQGSWQWNTTDLTVSGVTSTTQGQSYRVEGLDLEPKAQQLADATGAIPETVAAHDLFVPFDAPSIIARTAATVTQGATTEYEKAVALQNYFQNDGFVYSTTAPVHNSYDGDSMQSIAAFLKVKSGYCVHFASAMAIMARTLGIPSRIGIGYLPGTVVGSRNGQTLFGVTSDELHAWPELYFSGVGWVQFEPTVSRGSLPAYTIPGGATSSVPNSTVPSRSPGALAPGPDKTNLSGVPTQTTAAQELGAVVSSVLVAIFLLALLLLPAGVRRWQRRSRLRLLRDEWGSPRLAWKELRQSARDLRIAVPDTETPRAFAVRIGELIDSDPAASAGLESLLEATEREEFGRPGHGMIDPDRADELRAVLNALATRAPIGVRARALFLPVSLLPQTDQLLRGRARLTA
ncbi:transglutaminase family protein [Rathayibacter soli]|uniref:transglutaminase family protein n=1 Tax=Rathayibacter soli TaxID=3144168 RepID=UPI0027E4A557|nr:DUF3488 and transglutaminase-like domain-containing protein [Glaciibacter superstes]